MVARKKPAVKKPITAKQPQQARTVPAELEKMAGQQHHDDTVKKPGSTDGSV